MSPQVPALANALLRELLDRTSDLLVCVAADGRIAFANRTWREVLGLVAAEGLHLRDFLSPDAFAALLPQLDRVLRGEEIGPVGLLLRARQGSNLEVEGQWLRANANAEPHVIGTFRRSEPRSRVEVYLHSLLALRERTGEEIPAFFAAATEALAKAIGVERASIWLFDDLRAHIVCKDIYLLGPGRHESGAMLRAQDYPSYFRAAMHDSAIIAEDAHTHPATRDFSAGYLTPLDIRSMLDVPIRSGDQLRGVICLEHTQAPRVWASEEVKFAIAVANHLMVAIEQAERRRVELSLQESGARLERAIQASGLGYWDWNVPEGKATFSGHWGAMLGYDLDEIEHDIKTWEKLVHPDDLPRVVAAFQAHIDGKSDTYSEEHRLRTSSGQYRWILTQGRAVQRDGSGRAVWVSGIHKDVHDRRLAEDALRELNASLERRVAERTQELVESERFSRATLDALASHVVILDQDSKILFANRAWRTFASEHALWGKDPYEGVAYRPIAGASHEFGELADQVGAGIAAVIAGERDAFQIDYPFRRGVGESWFRCRVGRFPGEGPLRVVVQHANITDERAVQAELRQSSDVFRAIAESQAAYLERGDWKGAITRLLRHALEETGSALGFFGVMVAGRLRVLAHEGIVWHDVKGREHFDAAVALYRRQGFLEFANLKTLFGHCVTTGEVVLTNSPASDPRAGGLAEGHLPLTNFLGVPVVKSGKVMGMIALANCADGYAQGHLDRVNSVLQTVALLLESYLHELSEAELQEQRERAEREIRQALATLDATDDGAFIFDPESLRFTYVNEGAVRQVGYSREQLLTMTPLDIAPQLKAEEFRRRVAALQAGEAPLKHYTTTHRTVDGREIPVEINLQYIAPKGEPPRFIAIARDVAERTRAERLALRSQRLEAIGTLAGGVAHDLNNALTPILMAVEGMRDSLPQHAGLLEILEASARRASGMVRQLLTFAKGADGTHVPLAPKQLVEEVHRLAKSTFPKSIRAVVECDPHLPGIRGDATQLHQVLLNLAVNARDAMPAGGTLTLEARAVEVDAEFARSVPDARPGSFVMLRIRDTGTGIPPEIIDRIFEPFFTTKGVDSGTGLGLSTVMGIIKGHRGFMHVQSQPGQGSSFSAYLPALSGEAVPVTTETADSSYTGRRRTLLFVDDEPAIRKMATMVFNRLGLNLVACASGKDALATLSALGNQVDGLITDLHMPEMDGVGLARRLREMAPKLRVAVFSGRLEEDVLAELRLLGVEHYLRKPFSQGEVSTFLATFLE
jgi:PAS domain S-box-containing protein